MAGAAGYKTQVALCMQTLGAATNCAAGSNGISAAIAATNVIEYVTALTVAVGVISITTEGVDSAGANMQLVMTPSTVVGQAAVNWTLTGTACSFTVATAGRGINCTP
jgi:hypothetical protein